MPEFQSDTIEFGTIPLDDKQILIHGPSVACVAWIPFYGDQTELPPCSYQQHALARSKILPSGLSVLFWSGNPSDRAADSNPSPAGFSDRSQFLRLIESKNFRGALALDDVTLVMTEKGYPLRVSYRYFDEVGYTPLRAKLGSTMLTHYDQGIGGPDMEFEPVNGALTIRYWLRFKVGKLADFGSFILTGQFAPTALMEIDYLLEKSGRVSISFLGTAIPSQSYYINWSRDGLHDMIGNSLPAIDDFLGAGVCQDAPAPMRCHVERAVEVGLRD